jgi:hypothetical protein
MGPAGSDTTPGDDMTAAFTPAETARLAALLDRLDPQPAVCQVPGCLHVHVTHDSREDAPALAA